jgi:hypothetical protein
MDITFFSQTITYLVFGWLGYLLGKRLAAPTRFAQWVIWFVLLVIADKILIIQIANIFGFVIDSGSVLQALVVGIVINFAFRPSGSQTQFASSSNTAKS